VPKNLPPRPNLDHLRRQAKSLLAAIGDGEADAITTMVQHLPAAGRMTPAQVRSAGFRLADAQSAIARKTGFAGWPQLSRHVEQLRALEGVWEFASLEIDGRAMPASVFSTSRLLIDGDRFRSETPEATYEGIFNIDVEAEPHAIDIEFVAGPEAGNTNRGIFRFDADRLEICLDINGKPRPAAFRTSPGSGHVLETLLRASRTRPESVTGGAAPAGAKAAAVTAAPGFEYRPSPTLTRLQGRWSAVKVIRDGQELPSFMCATGQRSASNNEVKISFGGKVMIHALVRVDDRADPVSVDYYNLAGPAKGTVQHGIMQWMGDEACFCMAAPDRPRPADFGAPAGTGRTFSQWRQTKD
jgi:uncharacterized protein (TIGR03067 family)